MPTRDRFLRTLGQRVRHLREERGLTQEKLGEKAQLDQTYISGIECGARNPSALVLSKIAAALKVSLAQLVEGV